VPVIGGALGWTGVKAAVKVTFEPCWELGLEDVTIMLADQSAFTTSGDAVDAK
jgi:hypothetical protein